MLYLVHQLLQLFVLVIFADAILSYVPEVRRQKWAQVLHKIADVPQKPIREALPQGMPVDPTPMIVIIVIQIIMHLL